MSTSHEKIRFFLTQNLGLNLADINDDSPLFTSGIVDSFALFELLSYLESEFKCKIDIADLNIDDVDTISGIASLAK